MLLWNSVFNWVDKLVELFWCYVRFVNKFEVFCMIKVIIKYIDVSKVMVFCYEVRYVG